MSFRFSTLPSSKNCQSSAYWVIVQWKLISGILLTWKKCYGFKYGALGQSILQYYIEGEEVVWHWALLWAITELGDLKSSEVWYLEAEARIFLEAITWIDWWFYTAKSLALMDTSKRAKVKRPFVAGARIRLLVVKTAPIIWANALLKSCDAILGKVKDNLSFESYIELGNAPISCLTELFSWSASERAAEKSSQVLMMRLFGKWPW